MNAQTIWWFVLLALIKNVSCEKKVSFNIEKSHLQLTAKEGSCIEIKCKVTTYSITTVGAYWFWMKNAVWNRDSESYNATIIYSSNKSLRPVSPDFANRVTYIGSPASSWNIPSGKYCSILICDLNKTDSGNYIFRFIGELKWKTDPSVLTVEENPCLITFEEPSVVKESDMIDITCSTLSSCHSNPEMFGLTQWSPTPSQQGDKKSTTVRLTVDRQDDGKVISCQTQDNKDVFLIRNITLTVEYAPKDALGEISPKDSGIIKEGQTVTLTCSSKGRPEPTFGWFSNTNEMHSGAEWKLQYIKPSQSGEYHCEAKNKHGTMTSNPIRIDVKYSPQVEVEMTPSTSVVNQGDRITLRCNVKSSDPQPSGYTWLKDGRQIGFQQTHVVESIQPEDSGAYRCRATNIVGPGTSAQRQIIVNYRPRYTAILISKSEIKVGDYLTFTCSTDAQPAAHIYSWWYRNNNDKQTDSSQWKYKTTTGDSLTLSGVQRADEACYICKATNTINTGENSEPKCIRVLYPPTKPTLSMDTEVREGHLITISCTVESSPLSHLTLTSTSISQSLWPFSQSDENILKLTFNVTSTHAGFYTCAATNRIGSNKSDQRQLVVKYRPTDVKVQAQPNLVLKENVTLKLHCSAQANPQVTSVTWMKMTDGDIKIIQKESSPYFTVKSVSSSDSGLYSCAASNEIGTGNSTRAEVKVKYAPKHTNILSAAEQQETDGTRSVMVSCSSHSYPPVTHYSWHMKMETKEGSSDEKVSDHQNYTVHSHQPGVYYCIAKNEINQRSSDPVQLFVERGFMKVLKFFFLSLIILLVIVFIFFVYRHKRNKSIRQGTTNPTPCCGFLGWRDCDRSHFRNEPVMPEPFRSRDDLLPDQPCRPKAHRRQPHPDSTPDSNINTVYCTVQPVKQQGPSAQKPIRQQRGHTEDDSINYATLHFENKQKKAKAEQDVVYSTVLKKNPPNKNEQESMADYENISTANSAKSPNPLNYDTDTSEDEVEVNYSQVSFKAKHGHQRESSDSSTSDEEETQYSQVKI